MQRKDRRGRKGGFITANEVACFVYCPEQWRLQYGMGLRPGNQKSLNAGTRHHARKTLAEWIAGNVIGFGRVLIILALTMLVLLWLVWR